MTLAIKRSNWGLKASLMAPVLAVGLMASAPASAAGLGGVATLGDVRTDAASNLVRVGHRHRHRRRYRRRRNAAIGIGLGILGAAIIANHHSRHKHRYYDEPVRYRGRSGYRALKRKCARVYGDDYEWRSDLVYNGYGEPRVCKYIRRAGY